jgi:hypothetical protein
VSGPKKPAAGTKAPVANKPVAPAPVPKAEPKPLGKPTVSAHQLSTVGAATDPKTGEPIAKGSYEGRDSMVEANQATEQLLASMTTPDLKQDLTSMQKLSSVTNARRKPGDYL